MSADDWAPSTNWDVLRLRADLLRRTRAFFDQRGFLEVETPLLSADTVVDRHLDPLAVTLPHDVRRPDAGRRLWLQTSPEFAMKRLMAAGAEAIYQITRAFRAGESGPLHNPEFTIVEWYRAGDSMADGIELLSALAEGLLSAGPAERLSYRDAFLQFAKIDLLTCATAQLSDAAKTRRHPAPAQLGDDRDAWLDFLLSELVAPNLGLERPAIIFDYPASQAALARVCDDDPRVAERFELFFRGVELANGYHELLDADELRRRNAVANALRIADGKPALPEDSRLLAAMDHGLPACTGMALGFDRVVMLAAGATSLAEVMPFPIDRA
jgi:lysyl-tRNA synthetase class 2